MMPYVFFSKNTNLIKALTFLMFSILSFKLSAFQPDNVVPIDLSIADQKKFEDMSCRKFVDIEKDRIYAQTIKGLNYPTSVFVDCKPHNKLDGYPLRISISCRPTDGKWNCEYPDLQAFTTMSGHKIIVSSDPKEIYGAIEVVKFLDEIGKFKEDNFLKWATKENICSSYEFKNSKWSVECNGRWGYDVKQLCDDNKCHFELVREDPVLD
jgi:hypothetical protein